MANNLSIFDISGRAMSAQLVRLNTTASNLANAGTVSGSENTAFRAMKPVFRTVMGEAGKGEAFARRVCGHRARFANDARSQRRDLPE